MLQCNKHPLSGLFHDYGYNTILLPREGVEPLQILLDKGKFLQSDELITSLLKGENEPNVQRNISAANFYVSL